MKNWFISQTFKPSPSRLGLGGSKLGNRLMRVDEWTTNGYWLLLTRLEPEFIKRLAEIENKPNVKSILENHKGLLFEMEVLNELKVLSDKLIVVKLKTDSFGSWVNVYYLSLFLSLPNGRNLRFYQKDSLSPIFINDSSDKTIGVIMPVRTH